MNTKTITFIIISLLKVKDKEKMLKAARENEMDYMKACKDRNVA